MSWHLCGLERFLFSLLCSYFTSCLKLGQITIWILRDSFLNHFTSFRNCWEMWPETGQAFRENETSIDAYFEGAHSWHDLVIRITFVIIWYQLTVNITHCILFRHQIENYIGSVWTQSFYDRFFGVHSIIFVLLLVMSCIPLVQMTILTVLDYKN